MKFVENDLIARSDLEKLRKRGKKNREAGQRFELKVRKDLESKGWVVDRWSNNVEFVKETIPQKNSPYDKEIIIGKLIPAKSRFGLRTTGFPDFISFSSDIFTSTSAEKTSPLNVNMSDVIADKYDVIGVEVKSNGYLDKIEKEKCKWLLKNNIFSKILIASKGKVRRGEIVYKEVKMKDEK